MSIHTRMIEGAPSNGYRTFTAGQTFVNFGPIPARAVAWISARFKALAAAVAVSAAGIAYTFGLPAWAALVIAAVAAPGAVHATPNK